MINLKILKITIAVTNTTEMVNFYNTVFNSNLKEIATYGTKLYSGNFIGLELLLCPNEIAGVNAKQNRQQFDISVSDINSVLDKVIKNSGTIKEVYNKTTKSASVIDPDGNTIVFIENHD